MCVACVAAPTFSCTHALSPADQGVLKGIITVPVAMYGFFLFPDTPAETTAFYLSDEERKLANSRVPRSPRDAHTMASPLTWGFAKRVLLSWQWWGFVGLWIIAGETESFSSNSLLSLYMKSSPATKYTVSQLNNYPSGVPAVGILSTLFWATLTDVLAGKRYLVGYFIGVTGIATSVMILAASTDPTSGKSTAAVFGAYYWAGAVYACQATFFAWANDALRFGEPMLRAVVLAGMNLGSGAVNAWWSLIFYGAATAPWFKVGNYLSSTYPFTLRQEAAVQLFGQCGDGTDDSLGRHVGYDGHEHCTHDVDGGLDIVVCQG